VPGKFNSLQKQQICLYVVFLNCINVFSSIFQIRGLYTLHVQVLVTLFDHMCIVLILLFFILLLLLLLSSLSVGNIYVNLSMCTGVYLSYVLVDRTERVLHSAKFYVLDMVTNYIVFIIIIFKASWDKSSRHKDIRKRDENNKLQQASW